MWDLLQIEYVRVVFIHLGYPLYLLWILGVRKLPLRSGVAAPAFRSFSNPCGCRATLPGFSAIDVRRRLHRVMALHGTRIRRSLGG
jgi:hypothetical protein